MASVFITGASSGLGWQMAVEFASRGYKLALCARRLEKLEELKAKLSEYPVEVHIWTLDVKDENAQATVMAEAYERLGSLDIIIANAGIGNAQAIGRGDFASTRETIEINVIGAMATIHHGVQLLRQQGHGRLVAISSVAGERGLPNAGDYCASKSALSTYVESLRVETLQENLDITLLKPGYIDTPINQGADSRPFLVDLESGAKSLVDAIEKGVSRSCIPSWPWNFMAFIIRNLPGSVLARFGG